MSETVMIMGLEVKYGRMYLTGQPAERKQAGKHEQFA